MPSVRGRERILIAALLIGSAVASGALAGTTLAVVLAAPFAVATSLVGRPSPIGPAVGLVTIGLVLDLVAFRFGRLRPLTHGGQVPREWSDLLDARVVAVLYGARLGVGPLTILSTWGWWSAAVASALLGVGTAALVGATFGLVRQLVTVGVSLAAERHDHAGWFGRLRAWQRPSRGALTGIGMVGVAAIALVGCGSPSARPRLEPTPATATPLDATPAIATGPSSGEIDDAISDGNRSGTGTNDTTLSTSPAQLEDFVRPSPTGPTRTTAPPTTATVEPAVLAAALPGEIAGFEPIDEPMADRYLDIGAAAAIQPDPTEEIALLETRGYRGGWLRAFRNSDNDVAITSVYEFESAEEAEFYLEDGLILIGGYGGRFFDMEGLPGVRGFSQQVDGEEELVTLGAAFQAGPRWFLVYLLGSPDSVTPDQLVPVITAQRETELTLVGHPKGAS